MQDGANPDSGQPQGGGTPQPDGLSEPQAIPLGDPTDLPKADPNAAGGQAKPPAQGAPDEGLDYWKGEAAAHREKSERFTKFEGLIGYLEQNPQAVDQLEQLIIRGATSLAAHDDLAAQEHLDGNSPMDEHDRLSMELGAEPSAPAQAQGNQPPVDQNELMRRAREQGAAEERARLRFEKFQAELLERGVPEHSVDEFVQFLRNPNELSYYDLFAAYNSHRAAGGRDPINIPPGTDSKVAQPQAQTPAQAPQGQQAAPQPPTPVQQMPGQTNRPEEGRHQPNEEHGDSYVSSPNEI